MLVFLAHIVLATVQYGFDLESNGDGTVYENILIGKSTLTDSYHEEQIKEVSETLTFSRAKTARTDVTQAPVRVYLSGFAMEVIDLYGSTDKSPENFIFDFVNHQSDIETQHRKLKAFIRFVNQHFLKYAKSLGIKDKISTYWTRHSYATNAIRSGASMEFVSEALSHRNLNTTKAYFAGFADEDKREMAKKLMDF